ncbi:MAG TPA: ABC transporter permease [Thermomicrobiales bacterium]|nr:ABC transporter permease [Thermomicrobiales bacterium]
MRDYVLRRLVQLPIVLLFLSVIVFGVLRLIPGDPTAIRLGMESTEEGREQVRREMGLDKPLVVQYGIWLRDVTTGDFGTSWVSRQSVSSLILQKLPATVTLAVASLTIGILIAIPAGIIAGAKAHTWVDNVISTLALGGVATPTFWFGIMLILVLGVRFQWLPPSGYVPLTEDPVECLKRLFMPALALGTSLAAPLSRFMRSGMLDVLSADYIRVARAKGLRESAVILGHAVRNALLSVVTVLGLQFGNLLGGTVIIEQVFEWPGIGLLILSAINQRDYGIVQGVVLFAALTFILVNLLVDVLYVYIDPRIEY